MKKEALAISLMSLLLTTSTTAGNMGPVSIPQNWTGIYIGGNVGGGWSSQTQNLVSFITDSGIVFATNANYGTESDSNFVGGGQVGFDYQLGTSFLIGIQGQFDWGHLSGSHPLPAFPTFIMHNKTNNFDTLTGRVGYAFPNSLLIYVKAGGAWVRSNDVLLQPSGQLSESASFHRTGYTVGPGLEWMLAPHWSIFAEYNYIGLGSHTTAFIAPPHLSLAGENVNISQNVQSVLVGINYKFNGFNA